MEVYPKKTPTPFRSLNT